MGGTGSKEVTFTHFFKPNITRPGQVGGALPCNEEKRKTRACARSRSRRERTLCGTSEP